MSSKSSEHATVTHSLDGNISIKYSTSHPHNSPILTNEKDTSPLFESLDVKSWQTSSICLSNQNRNRRSMQHWKIFQRMNKDIPIPINKKYWIANPTKIVTKAGRHDINWSIVTFPWPCQKISSIRSQALIQSFRSIGRFLLSKRLILYVGRPEIGLLTVLNLAFIID